MKVTYKGKDFYLYRYLSDNQVKKEKPVDDDGYEIDKSKKSFFYYKINGTMELIFCLTENPKSDYFLLREKYSSRPDIIWISSDISNVISLDQDFYKENSVYLVKPDKLLIDKNNLIEFFEEIQKQLRAH